MLHSGGEVSYVPVKWRSASVLSSASPCRLFPVAPGLVDIGECFPAQFGLGPILRCSFDKTV